MSLSSWKSKAFWRSVTFAAGLGVVVCTGGTAVIGQQPTWLTRKMHLNKIIEQLEQGKPAILGQHFQLFDLQHSPYVIEKVEAGINAIPRDEFGRPTLTPMVRIPMDGNSDARWAILQLLDMGVISILVPQVENREGALNKVQAMRYTAQEWTKNREPRGLRNYGAGRAAKYWGLDVLNYAKRADLWPLQPDGELFLVVEIETLEGIRNMEEILTTPGVSAVMVVFADLTMAYGLGPHMGFPLRPEIEQVYLQFLKTCTSLKAAVCGMSDIGTNSENRIKQGFKLIFGVGETAYTLPQ